MVVAVKAAVSSWRGDWEGGVEELFGATEIFSLLIGVRGYTDASIDQNSPDSTQKIHFIVRKLSFQRYWRAKKAREVYLMTFLACFIVSTLQNVRAFSQNIYFGINLDLKRMLKRVFPFWNTFP